MKNRLLLSTLLVVLCLLAACGNEPLASSSAAVRACDAGPTADASVDDGLGTSPSLVSTDAKLDPDAAKR